MKPITLDPGGLTVAEVAPSENRARLGRVRNHISVR